MGGNVLYNKPSFVGIQGQSMKQFSKITVKFQYLQFPGVFFFLVLPLSNQIGSCANPANYQIFPAMATCGASFLFLSLFFLISMWSKQWFLMWLAILITFITPTNYQIFPAMATCGASFLFLSLFFLISMWSKQWFLMWLAILITFITLIISQSIDISCASVNCDWKQGK